MCRRACAICWTRRNSNRPLNEASGRFEVSSPATTPAPDSPFSLDNAAAYLAWREQKLSGCPSRVEDLVVEVHDPRCLTEAEHDAILQRCRRTNMAVYRSDCGADPDKAIPKQLGLQLGLTHLDRNLLADDDGITALSLAAGGARLDYIPYSNRPLNWHTDGYYNVTGRQIRAMLLHCVRPAMSGGINALLDHEIAYIMLRDADTRYVQALMETDAMTIPERIDEHGVARPAQTGPVFSVDPESGTLHMRYTARTRSIVWKQNPETLAAREFLDRLMASDTPYIFRVRLEAGMGIVCNNVLHNRSGFAGSGDDERLLYRARYYDHM